MTEQNNFVYEWLYDEEVQEYYCLGQVFYLSVSAKPTSIAEDLFGASVWDTAPVSENVVWSLDTNDDECIDYEEFDDINKAMDWCEQRDINEAEYDASVFLDNSPQQT
jgi:hypothetical protein